VTFSFAGSTVRENARRTTSSSKVPACVVASLSGVLASRWPIRRGIQIQLHDVCRSSESPLLMWPTILANEWETALMKIQDLVGLRRGWVHAMVGE
jgi:hypothetical protein